MTKRFLALALCLALALAGCAPAQPPTEPSSVLLGVSQEDKTAPEDTSPPEAPSGFDDLEEAAKVLTGTILKDALLVGAAEGWHGEEELLDLLTFTIQAALTQGHPYQEWFPCEEESGLYCYPKDAVQRMAWEIFGLQDWEPEHLGPLQWNKAEDRWESTLECGLRWPSFQAEGEMTAAWKDGDTLTVSLSLSKAGTVHGDPGFLPLGDATFTYHRMEEDGHTFLRFTAMEVEKYKTFRYNTIPGVTIPEGPVGKVLCSDRYVGKARTTTDPDAIATVLDLLGQITVYDLPAEPFEGPYGMKFIQFFTSPEDETPAFTVAFDPFCVEVNETRSNFYTIDDSNDSPEGNASLIDQIYLAVE